MPKIKKTILTIFILGLSFTFYIWNRASSSKPGLIREKAYSKFSGDQYFAHIPIAHFSTSNLPYLEVEIEKQRFLLLLDLGYSRYVSLHENLVKKLQQKTFLKVVKNRGFRGIEYGKNYYKIPKIKIGPLSINHIGLEEECSKQQQNSILYEKKSFFSFNSRNNDGKLGWQAFKNTVLLLDLGNECIKICSSIETFKTEYSLENFTQIPLSTDQNLVEFETTTTSGSLRCFLDTGCTVNMINKEPPDGVSLEKAFLDENNTVKFTEFKIGDKDFGETSFHALPIRLPIKVEAVIGMEFLMNHQVLIDFKNEYIYFSKNPKFIK